MSHLFINITRKSNKWFVGLSPIIAWAVCALWPSCAYGAQSGAQTTTTSSLPLVSAVAMGVMACITIAALLYAWRARAKTAVPEDSEEPHSETSPTDAAQEWTAPLAHIIEAGERLASGEPLGQEEARQLGQLIVIHGNDILRLANDMPTDAPAQKPVAVIQHATSQHLSRDEQEFLNKVVNQVHEQLSAGNLDADALAASMGLSRKQLRTRIQAITGDTTVNFVMNIRLSKARRMLCSTNDSVSDISQKCGFHDVAYFSRTFKQQFGLTPSQCRRQGE